MLSVLQNAKNVKAEKRNYMRGAAEISREVFGSGRGEKQERPTAALRENLRNNTKGKREMRQK